MHVYFIVGINKNGYVFQGDMIMSKDEIDTAIHGGDVDKPKEDLAFGLSRSLYRKWPKGIIPYDITAISK